MTIVIFLKHGRLPTFKKKKQRHMSSKLNVVYERRHRPDSVNSAETVYNP